MSEPGPGIYPTIPFADYLRWPYPSQTILKAGRESAMHMKAAMDTPFEPTDAMLLGTALHTCFLEPEQAARRVIEWTGPRRAGKEWDVFKAEHAGKVILTSGMYASLVGMVGSLRKHPFTRAWVGRITDIEVAGVADIAGVRCKGRCDALTDEPLVDLKKTRTNDPRLFAKAVYEYGYHIQCAMYRRLFKRQRFVLLTVEDQPPFRVVPFELDPATLHEGEQELFRLIGMYQHGMKNGVWDGGYDDAEPVTISLPDWAIPTEVRISAER